MTVATQHIMRHHKPKQKQKKKPGHEKLYGKNGKIQRRAKKKQAI